MAENNRNRNVETNQQNQNIGQKNTQTGQRENIRDQSGTFQNPQEGDQWSNYRSRELSSNPEQSSNQNSNNE